AEVRQAQTRTLPNPSLRYQARATVRGAPAVWAWRALPAARAPGPRLARTAVAPSPVEGCLRRLGRRLDLGCPRCGQPVGSGRRNVEPASLDPGDVDQAAVTPSCRGGAGLAAQGYCDRAQIAAGSAGRWCRAIRLCRKNRLTGGVANRISAASKETA